MIRECTVCSAPFDARSLWRRCKQCLTVCEVCGGSCASGQGRCEKCKYAPSRARYELTCVLCGIAFVAGQPLRRWCDNCRVVPCVVCGATVKRGNCPKNYCPPCYATTHAAPMLECERCGTSFKQRFGNATKYCGDDCRYKAARKPDANQDQRRSWRYKQWRDGVYERDGYKCRRCGDSENGIQAHHIQEWADAPALRFVVDNGETLCRTCHENHHGARIPRVCKRFPPTCEACSVSTKGRSRYCKSCGIKHSDKFQSAMLRRERTALGQFATAQS